MEQPRIGILTCTTRNRKWLYDITNETKRRFVQNKPNVDYVFSDTFDKNINWGLYWLKPQFIKEHISNYDYVLWMDDDAGFIRDFDIIKFCTYLNEVDGSIFVAEDINGINAGVILLKNDEHSNALLDFEIQCGSDSEFQAEPSGDNHALRVFCVAHEDVVKLLNGSIFNAYHKFTTPEGGPNMINAQSVIVHIAGGNRLKEILGPENIKKIFGVGNDR